MSSFTLYYNIASYAPTHSRTSQTLLHSPNTLSVSGHWNLHHSIQASYSSPRVFVGVSTRLGDQAISFVVSTEKARHKGHFANEVHTGVSMAFVVVFIRGISIAICRCFCCSPGPLVVAGCTCTEGRKERGKETKEEIYERMDEGREEEGGREREMKGRTEVRTDRQAEAGMPIGDIHMYNIPCVTCAHACMHGDNVDQNGVLGIVECKNSRYWSHVTFVWSFDHHAQDPFGMASDLCHSRR